MAYESIYNRNLSEGLHVPFCYVNDVTGGLFMNLLIFVTYIVLLMGIYFTQKKLTGKGDAPVAAAASGYAMAGFAIFLGMIPCLLDGWVVVQVIVMAAVGTLWLIFDKKSNY